MRAADQALPELAEELGVHGKLQSLHGIFT